jgi:hypothetical protein
MGSNDLSNENQADAGPIFLGGGKGLERIDVQWDPRTCVRNIDHNPGFSGMGIDDNFPAARHGFCSILYQVKQGLFDLIAIDDK